MTTLTVDFEVWKEINNRRRSEEHTENDVLRELLGLSDSTWAEKQQLARKQVSQHAMQRADSNAPWLAAHGVQLPIGTAVTTLHKGKTHRATIEAEGLRYNGQVYASLTEAARDARGYPCNGWETWYVQPTGSTEAVLINTLRPANKVRKSKGARSRKNK